jgi:hypothetical protein
MTLLLALVTMSATGMTGAAQDVLPKTDPPRVVLDRRLGEGSARFVVKWRPFGDERGRKAVRVEGTSEKARLVPADGKEHAIRVQASFPNAAAVTIGNERILAVFRDDEPTHFVRDLCAGWALLSDRTDPRSGKAPLVVCRDAKAACPDGFVTSTDPPLHRDSRCANADAANSDTAAICYRPGRVRFESNVPKKVRVFYTVTDVSQVVEVVPGAASAPIPFEYERCRPRAIEVDGRVYFLAVGRGEDWLVTITKDRVHAKVQ